MNNISYDYNMNKRDLIEDLIDKHLAGFNYKKIRYSGKVMLNIGFYMKAPFTEYLFPVKIDKELDKRIDRIRNILPISVKYEWITGMLIVTYE